MLNHFIIGELHDQNSKRSLTNLSSLVLIVTCKLLAIFCWILLRYWSPFYSLICWLIASIFARSSSWHLAFEESYSWACFFYTALIRKWARWTILNIFWQSERITCDWTWEESMNSFDFWRYFRLSLMYFGGSTFCKIYCLKFFMFFKSFPGFDRN